MCVRTCFCQGNIIQHIVRNRYVIHWKRANYFKELKNNFSLIHMGATACRVNILKKLEIESENSVKGKVKKNRKFLFIGIISWMNIFECLFSIFVWQRRKEWLNTTYTGRIRTYRTKLHMFPVHRQCPWSIDF